MNNPAPKSGVSIQDTSRLRPKRRGMNPERFNPIALGEAMRILVPILIVLVVFFAFPVLNETPLPQSFDPQELGGFVRASFQYWQDLFSSVFN